MANSDATAGQQWQLSPRVTVWFRGLRHRQNANWEPWASGEISAGLTWKRCRAGSRPPVTRERFAPAGLKLSQQNTSQQGSVAGAERNSAVGTGTKTPQSSAGAAEQEPDEAQPAGEFPWWSQVVIQPLYLPFPKGEAGVTPTFRPVWSSVAGRCVRAGAALCVLHRSALPRWLQTPRKRLFPRLRCFSLVQGHRRLSGCVGKQAKLITWQSPLGW